MPTRDISRDIEVILHAELVQFRDVGRHAGGLGSLVTRYGGEPRLGPGTEWRRRGDTTARWIVPDAPCGTMSSSHIDTLRTLYAALDTDTERGVFREILLGHLRVASPFKEITYFIVWGSHAVGDISTALLLARAAFADTEPFILDDVVRLLDTLVRFESHSFDRAKLDAIDTFAAAVPGDHTTLQARLADARLEALRRDLDEVNPAINQDRERAVRLWAEEFETDTLGAMVRRIEEMFRGGGMDATAYATCMDRIRALLIEVCRQIAGRVAATHGKDEQLRGRQDREVVEYLARTDIAFLTKQEQGLLRALYSLTSEYGAHRLIAEREHARLTKNIAYEVFLLLMEKLRRLRTQPLA